MELSPYAQYKLYILLYRLIETHIVWTKLLSWFSLLRIINKIVRHRIYITGFVKRYIPYCLTMKVIGVKKISFVYARKYFHIHVFYTKGIIIKRKYLKCIISFILDKHYFSLITYCYFHNSQYINLHKNNHFSFNILKIILKMIRSKA